MTATMEQWDVKVRPRLQDMQMDASWIKFYADKISASAQTVNGLPSWETEAEACIKEANEALAHALAKLQKAQFVIQQKREAAC